MTKNCVCMMFGGVRASFKQRCLFNLQKLAAPIYELCAKIFHIFI